ncbi:uncharacterized protein L201_003958 [Kwoniella dendrophila CBS 6074]|uniref:Ricin B lectin domain-containing protein n=1 Tax=Kwoniella dendrophila CBS 6074 TaxID=1295534 RepID=A0AAX4JWZ0_9TREE
MILLKSVLTTLPFLLAINAQNPNENQVRITPDEGTPSRCLTVVGRYIKEGSEVELSECLLPLTTNDYANSQKWTAEKDKEGLITINSHAAKFCLSSGDRLNAGELKNSSSSLSLVNCSNDAMIKKATVSGLWKYNSKNHHIYLSLKENPEDAKNDTNTSANTTTTSASYCLSYADSGNSDNSTSIIQLGECSNAQNDKQGWIFDNFSNTAIISTESTPSSDLSSSAAASQTSSSKSSSSERQLKGVMTGLSSMFSVTYLLLYMVYFFL